MSPTTGRPLLIDRWKDSERACSSKGRLDRHGEDDRNEAQGALKLAPRCLLLIAHCDTPRPTRRSGPDRREQK